MQTKNPENHKNKIKKQNKEEKKLLSKFIIALHFPTHFLPLLIFALTLCNNTSNLTFQEEKKISSNFPIELFCLHSALMKRRYSALWQRRYPCLP